MKNFICQILSTTVYRLKLGEYRALIMHGACIAPAKMHFLKTNIDIFLTVFLLRNVCSGCSL